MRTTAAIVLCLALAACGSTATPDDTSPETPPPGDELPPDEPPAGDRPMMTVEECEARGTVVGDIGDGAVHRPDYVCPGGGAPIGTVPSGIEGAVCCPHDGDPAPACAAEGWPQPTGEIAEGCEAVHDGCCYPSAGAACAAAGCEADACVVMESYPAQVRCE